MASHNPYHQGGFGGDSSYYNVDAAGNAHRSAGNNNDQSMSQPERSWPQSEFVKRVIEAPIDLANPGWREKEVPNGRSIRLRAEAGMRDIDGARSTAGFGASTAGRDNLAISTGFPSASTSSVMSREGRKIIPSHLTHMKYKGVDPIDPENKAQAMNNLQREDPTLYSGTGSFGTRTRRKSDAPLVAEDDQRRRDLEHELANFPPVLPTAMFASLSEDEIDSRRNALEDEVRLKYNIPARSSSPSSLRKSSHTKSGTLSRRLPPNAGESEHSSSRMYSSAVNLGGGEMQLTATTHPEAGQLRASPVHSGETSFAAVKALHPFIVSNHNTWRRILEHMLNHGVIVNPFNNITQFRLRSCFPPDTPTDILASADTRRPQYPPNPELLALANEVVMGADWIKLTYENANQALNALKSDGVFFDGFPLQITQWGEADTFSMKSPAVDAAPLWLLPPGGSGANGRESSLQPIKRKPTETFALATGKGRQLVLVNDDNIFLKQPGVFEQLKLYVYDWLFQNTAQYDEEGNYIKGTGGWMLDVWHIFVG